MGDERRAYMVLVGKLGAHWGDLGIDGRIILGWIPRRWYVDWNGPGQGRVLDTCECGNETSGSIKCGVFDQLQTSQLLKDFAPWSKQVCQVSIGQEAGWTLENRKVSWSFLDLNPVSSRGQHGHCADVLAKPVNVTGILLHFSYMPLSAYPVLM